MQFKRALFLSSERSTYHGAHLVSVASNIMSRALEYSYHLLRQGKSMGLNFHWRNGSVMRASNRRCCSASLTSSQYLTSTTPLFTIYLSASGQRLRKVSCCCFVQKPITYSTPARLYQLRSK